MEVESQESLALGSLQEAGGQVQGLRKQAELIKTLAGGVGCPFLLGKYSLGSPLPSPHLHTYIWVCEPGPQVLVRGLCFLPPIPAPSAHADFRTQQVRLDVYSEPRWEGARRSGWGREGSEQRQWSGRVRGRPRPVQSWRAWFEAVAGVSQDLAGGAPFLGRGYPG